MKEPNKARVVGYSTIELLPEPPAPPRNPVEWDKVIIVLMNILLIVALYIIASTTQEACQECRYCKNIVDYGESVKLYAYLRNTTVIKETIVQGLYSPTSGIYCINNKTTNDYDETQSHEFCHWLIDKEQCVGESCYEHFCNED